MPHPVEHSFVIVVQQQTAAVTVKSQTWEKNFTAILVQFKHQTHCYTFIWYNKHSFKNV
jgi:hypothetical protein